MTTQTWLQVARLAALFHGEGAQITAICPSESPLAFIPEVQRRFRFQPFSPLGSLRYAVESVRPDYVVPTDDLSCWLLYDLALRHAALRPLVERSLGSSAHYATLSSRLRLLGLAAEMGVQVADTMVLRDAADLERRIAAGLPFVLKKDGTWGGQGVHVVRTPEEARAAWAALVAGRSVSLRAAEWLRTGNGAAFARPSSLLRPQILAQAFVDGVPANSMYACRQGRILGEVQARVVATRGKTGPSIVIRLIEEPAITEAGRRIARALSLSGFFGLDFMMDTRTGEPFLIECNPRATQLGHVLPAGRSSLVEILASHWTGRPAAAPSSHAEQPTIWFYPDGKRLTNNKTALSVFRPDAPPDQMAAIDRRIREQAAWRSRTRRVVWKSLTRLKNPDAQQQALQAFYYPDSLPSSLVQEGESAGGSRSPFPPGRDAAAT